MGFLSSEQQKDVLHYVLVYSALLLAWPWVMNQLQQNVYLTAGVVFLVFIAADKVMHKVLKV